MVEVQSDKVIEALEKIENQEKMKSAIEKACLVGETVAKRNCPADTGELRASITSSVREEAGNIIGQVGTPLMYGNYVEYGTGLFSSNGLGRKEVPWFYKDDKTDEWIATSGEKPQPFLIPALNDNRTVVLEILKEALK